MLEEADSIIKFNDNDNTNLKYWKSPLKQDVPFQNEFVWIHGWVAGKSIN